MISSHFDGKQQIVTLFLFPEVTQLLDLSAEMQPIVFVSVAIPLSEEEAALYEHFVHGQC